MEQRLLQLGQRLSAESDCFSDPSTVKFKGLLKRWSELNVKIPAAIVVPGTELDCQKTVLWAHEHKIPFVSKSGGHSLWSTIGSDGVIIDLTRMSNVTVDVEDYTATLSGGIVTSDACRALTRAGVFAPLSNGNSVGVIPYFIGGGNHSFLTLTGYASDNILAARVITATGDLIEADSNHQTDLFWAIRGAGQHFGLVTSITVRIYPFSLLGNPGNTIWSGTFVFPLKRAEEVANVTKSLMEDTAHNIFGNIMISAPPPEFKPVVVIGGKLIGDPDDAPKAYKSVYELEPINITTKNITVDRLNDSIEAFCAKGDFKSIQLTGLTEFNIAGFLQTIELWQEMVAEHPDAKTSSFMLSWNARPAIASETETAWSHHNIRKWQNNFLWYTDQASTAKVFTTNEKVIEAVRAGQAREEYSAFPNSSRSTPVAWRYRGAERLAKLRQLKRKWDPNGVFTREFLDF